MRVIDDQHTIQPFKMTVYCSDCKSTLELDSHKDLHSRKVAEGMQHDSYMVDRIFFQCCLCHNPTQLTQEQEISLPKSVVRAVITAMHEKD